MAHDGPGCPAGPRRPRLVQGHARRPPGSPRRSGAASSAPASPPTSRPVADGGEGTMDVLLARAGGDGAHGPRTRSARARDRRRASRCWATARRRSSRSRRPAASRSSAPAERDAEAASSAGTGELIACAIDAGARHVLVAAGGSATTDGGDRRDHGDRAGRRPARRPHHRAVRRAHAVRARRARRSGRRRAPTPRRWRGSRRGSRRSGCRAACR